MTDAVMKTPLNGQGTGAEVLRGAMAINAEAHCTATFAERAAPLLKKGIPVFPCWEKANGPLDKNGEHRYPQGKNPRTPNGFKDATTDAQKVASWGRIWPDALVGVPTGKPSGLLVFDVDVRVDADGTVTKDGWATLREKGWTLPETRKHWTKQGGGAHFIFRQPDDETLKCSADKLGAGLDIRTTGGYVIWWAAEGYKVEHPDTYAELPAWLREAMQAEKTASPVRTADGAVFSEGGRNDTLFRLAASLRSKSLTVDAIEAALLVENAAKCNPPLGEDEVKTIARSTGRYPEGPSGGERCTYGNGEFEVSPSGVVFIGTDKHGNGISPFWICSPLYVRAKTRNGKSEAWGRLLEWCDNDGVPHKWALPLESLQADGLDVRKELAHLGLTISPNRKAQDLLRAYIQVWPVETSARCVDRLGWAGNVYVTPKTPVGQSEELVVFQNESAVEPAFGDAGTVDQWRESVARLASGNSRLVFALSVAFAAPLADVVNEDSGGFHLRGPSSKGKSTALLAAASVWGDPTLYPRSWRATANGIEGLAALHNDGILILDEISQCEPNAVGEAAYMLANGSGKTRAGRTGNARRAARWRLLFLSAGEESLPAIMARVGRKPTAGQEIRLADIEADAGAGMGLVEALHGHAEPQAFTLAVKDAAAKHYGAVGLEWLKQIVAARATLAESLPGDLDRFVKEAAPAGADGQALRVARRFALVARAGELATAYGLTGWASGEATQAVRKCFDSWLEGFGGSGDRETRALLSQVRAFLDAHGASRFGFLGVPSAVSQADDGLFDPPPADGEHVEGRAGFVSPERPIYNRAGFYRASNDGGVEYLVFIDSFKNEVCKGFDSKWAAKTLVAAGWLVPDGKRNTRVIRHGSETARVYVLQQRDVEG